MEKCPVWTFLGKEVKKGDGGGNAKFK